MVKTQPTESAARPSYHLSKRQRRFAINVLLLVACLSVFVMSFNRVIGYEDDVERNYFSIQGALPVPVLEMRPQRGETSLVAIVAHGFAGSKDLMTSFGAELARAGITAYLLDFPGHGQSRVAMADEPSSQKSNQQNVAAIDEVVDYARMHNSATKTPHIVLVGHSMGSAAVGDYVMAHANDDDIVGTILVSPVKQENLVPTWPKNLLLLAGQNDISSAIINSQRMLQQGCGWTAAKPLPAECGKPADGTGRRAVILPGQSHITILNASSTFQEMITWLGRVSPREVNTTQMQSDLRLFWLLLGALSILCAIVPLCSLLVNIFKIGPAPAPLRGLDVFIYGICLLLGIAASLSIQSFWQPFAFLNIRIADYVIGYFFFTGLITGLLIFLVRHIWPVPPLHQVISQVLIGVLISAFLYFTFGQLETFAWQRVTLNMPRLWRFGVMFLLVLPLFLLDANVTRGYQERGLIRGVLVSLAFKGLLVAGLFVSLLFLPGLSFLSIILPILIILFLVLIIFSTQLYASGHAAIAAAILSAFILAWSMATTFPLT
ncbi:MAG: alpha/beta fold hydrolase [Ktedonobacteraceae bacterium]|nr:alpha/beta fold hydrolase [Ktedonobacteraceae bacterium]